MFNNFPESNFHMVITLLGELDDVTIQEEGRLEGTVMTCSDDRRKSFLLFLTFSSKTKLMAVEMAVICFFQFCRASLSSSIIALRAANTGLIKDSTVSFAHNEYATAGLCRMR